jgi:hypothetical protein
MPLRGISKILGFGCLAVLVAFGLHALINTGLRRVRSLDMGAFNRVMSGRVNAEIVISGSSRAYGDYDPQVIREITGKSTFNLGQNGSHTDVQLAVLKCYLKHNVKPRLVVQNLDMHSSVLTPQEEINAQAEYVTYIGEEELYRTLLRINPNVWKWRHIPLYGYVVDDMSLTWLLFLRGLSGLNEKERLVDGYYGRDLAWTSDFDRFKAQHPKGVEFGIPDEGVMVLKDLIETCQSNHIELVLVYAPQYYEMLDLVRNRPEVFAKFHELSDQYHVPFLDYSQSDICKNKDYFYNSQHLNKTGAELFSSRLGQQLQSFFAAQGQNINTVSIPAAEIPRTGPEKSVQK